MIPAKIISTVDKYLMIFNLCRWNNYFWGIFKFLIKMIFRELWNAVGVQILYYYHYISYIFFLSFIQLVWELFGKKRWILGNSGDTSWQHLREIDNFSSIFINFNANYWPNRCIKMNKLCGGLFLTYIRSFIKFEQFFEKFLKLLWIYHKNHVKNGF